MVVLNPDQSNIRMSATDSLLCTVSHEILGKSGEPLKKTLHRNAELCLGRNQFREIVLRLLLGKREFRHQLKEITIHKKFAKDGKATLQLNNQNVRFMLSNCPPDRLIVFLKTLSTKLVCQSQKTPVTDRQRLLSEKPTNFFEEISPLVMQELQSAHTIRAKEVEQRTDLFTPKGKRKRDEACHEKENRLQKASKVPRRTGLSMNSTLLSKPVTAPVILSREQKKVLEVVKSGKNVFFTGSAGTGKSFLLKRIIGALPPQYTFATASTGVAACHIGGTTLHAFAGMGSGKSPIEQCVELAMRPTVAQQWKKCRHLIIDEISMVDGDFFNKMEAVARVIRQSDAPFGGIQLILCGDFLQLPPVTKRDEKRKFAFQSRAWRKCMEVNLELTEVRRQSDKSFIDILQNIRLGRCPPSVVESLTATSSQDISRQGVQATRLCTHKEDVEQINLAHLNRLKGAPKMFQATDSDSLMAKLLNSQCPVGAQLELREGAQVMLAKNLDVQQGLVNGARGVVTGFEPTTQAYPIVKFVCGVECTIQPERWTFKAQGGAFLTRRQLPLKLAWAISIHKSQGMSLDCVEMSLSRVFESGQAYVALSRARSLQGLRVVSFDKNCVRADPEVIKFYRQIQGDNRRVYQSESILDQYMGLPDSQRSQF